jgi:hypothetical protein
MRWGRRQPLIVPLVSALLELDRPMTVEVVVLEAGRGPSSGFGLDSSWAGQSTPGPHGPGGGPGDEGDAARSGMVKPRVILLVAVLFLGLAESGAAQRAGAPRLGVDGLVVFREMGSVAVLAEATPFWRPVATRTEELLGDFRYLPEYASARAQGQIFQLLASDAPKLAAGPEGRFVVVPWSFGPGCAEEGWATPEWVASGDTVAFLLIPTRSRPSGDQGLPVFDVLGWHQPYPVGELIPFWRKSPQVNPAWLSAGEYYELLTLLPSERAFRTDPQGALQHFQDWIEVMPKRDASFPVPEIRAGWAASGS